MPDLLQTDPDPSEEAALRALLHRAVDDLDVDAPAAVPLPVVRLDPARGRSRTPWLAAAAVLLLVAIGVGWWTLGNDDAVRSGPADGDTIEGLGTVLEQSGVWRLPAPDSGLQVTRAVHSRVGMLDTFVATDDVADPHALLMLAPVGWLSNAPGVTPPQPFVGGSTISTLTVEGPGASTWIEVAAPGGAGFLTAAFVGVDRAAVEQVLRTMVDGFGDAPVALSDMNRFAELIDSVELPEGLQPLWNHDDLAELLDPAPLDGTSDGDAAGDARSLALFLDDGDSFEGLGISLIETGLPGAVARRWSEIFWSFPTMDSTFRVAPELGTGVLSGVVDEVPTVLVVTEDGTQIMAGRTGLGGESVVASAVDPLPIEEQLAMIATLRAMSEAELRAVLRDVGAPLEPPDGPSDDGG